MRKIGIITINDPTNYGNRLQNYAMQEVLESLGYSVETIPHKRYEENRFLRYKKKINGLFKKMYRVLRKIYYVIFRIQLPEKIVSKKKRLLEKRKIPFQKFNDTYIKTCDYTIKSEYVPVKIKNKFDYFVVGSDQIWNPNYKYSKPTTYLRFTKKEKRIAIAASFGIEKLPEEQIEIVKKYLKDFAYVSVREESGSRLVEQLTGEKCDVVLDPTLLINSNEWEEMVEQCKTELPPNYILTYFLGGISEKNKEYINKFAGENNFQIINMHNEDEEDVFTWSPEVFLKAIKNCQYFFTDSFHGCVFSIIFHKQFLVFKRIGKDNNIFDRIETLLGNFRLESRVFQESIGIPEAIRDEDYQLVDSILFQKRKAITEKLREILK